MKRRRTPTKPIRPAVMVGRLGAVVAAGAATVAPLTAITDQAPGAVNAHEAPTSAFPQGEGGRALVEINVAPTPSWTGWTGGAVRQASRSRRADTSAVTGTHLSVTCYVATGHLTASGKVPQVGMAAGNRWPFGTRLRVEGIGIVTVQDRIGHGSELDLFFDSLDACQSFGRQYLRVAVVR